MSMSEEVRVTSENATHLREGYRVVAEASTLGVPPGRLPPDRLETDLGNGQLFYRTESPSEGPWEYKQLFGLLCLTIFND